MLLSGEKRLIFFVLNMFYLNSKKEFHFQVFFYIFNVILLRINCLTSDEFLYIFFFLFDFLLFNSSFNFISLISDAFSMDFKYDVINFSISLDFHEFSFCVVWMELLDLWRTNEKEVENELKSWLFFYSIRRE